MSFFIHSLFLFSCQAGDSFAIWRHIKINARQAYDHLLIYLISVEWHFSIFLEIYGCKRFQFSLNRKTLEIFQHGNCEENCECKSTRLWKPPLGSQQLGIFPLGGTSKLLFSHQEENTLQWNSLSTFIIRMYFIHRLSCVLFYVEKLWTKSGLWNIKLAYWVECSPMARKTWIQSQVASYQRL